MMENKKLPSAGVQTHAANKSKTTAHANGKGAIRSTSETNARDNRMLVLNDEGKGYEAMISSSKERPLSSDKPGSKAPPVGINRSNSASSTSSRTRTPTKYVKLQSVRRKDDTSAEDTRNHCHGDNKGKDEDSGSDSDHITAPNELMLEFLDCIMSADYANAQKLCKMILIYEPRNVEALRFQPLIDEKITLQSGEQCNEDDEEEVDEDTSTSEGESDDSASSASSEEDNKDDHVLGSSVKLDS